MSGMEVRSGKVGLRATSFAVAPARRLAPGLIKRTTELCRARGSHLRLLHEVDAAPQARTRDPREAIQLRGSTPTASHLPHKPRRRARSLQRRQRKRTPCNNIFFRLLLASPPSGCCFRHAMTDTVAGGAPPFFLSSAQAEPGNCILVPAKSDARSRQRAYVAVDGFEALLQNRSRPVDEFEPVSRRRESGKNSGVLCGSEQRRDWLKDRVEGQRRQVGLVPEPLS